MQITSLEKENILKKHNNYRNEYKCPDLVYDAKLCEFAQSRADTIAKSNQFCHASSCPYGENLYASTSDKDLSACVDSWMSEKYGWIEKENNWQDGLGHFSQVIWKTSKKLGVGKSKMPNGFWVIVCNYDPRGNIIGQKPYDF